VKPRVLQLIGSFHQGGSERQVVALTQMLKDEDSFDVRVAVLDGDGPLRSDVERLGIGEISEFPLTSFYNANFMRQVRRFAEFLRANEIDIIHTHDFYTNVFGMAAAFLAKTPVRIASKRETTGMRSRGQERLERIAFFLSSVIVANSVAVRDHLVGKGIGERRVELIYNGVEMPSGEGGVYGLHSRLDLPLAVKIVTLVANLRHDVKNVPMLLRAAKQVAEASPETHFVIAGEGGLRASLEKQAVDLEVADNVHFIGRCDDIPALLAESDVCILTSTAEGFSNSILEYMAAGKPVVATNVGGAAEAIADGETGFLIDSDNSEEMAERILELLDDGKKAATFGAAGREKIAENFSRATQLERTLGLYRRLLDS
jgi:glycosyltransferase involved in cell wall biosynthesis